MAKFAGPITKYPARAAFLWYLLVAILGTLALLHPACGRSDVPITALDAAFTSTSATCVTGLTVRSTERDFSRLGQAVILLQIQMGGIGIMTLTTFVTVGWRGRATLRQRHAITETLGSRQGGDLRSILRSVVLFVLGFEALGFAILAAHNLLWMPWQDALWEAMFHSVSAFCNAGFALYDDSLTRYQADPVTNATIMALIVTGGLGFPVMLDLRRNWHGDWSERWGRLHLHTKLMLLGTAALIAIGMLCFLALEWNNSLEGRSLGARLQAAAFQSVTARTAGFNTVDTGSLTNATLFIIMLLMMVGAGPCSTAGGVKVSTGMLLFLQAWSKFRGDLQVTAFRRTVPADLISRAIASVLLFTVVGVLALSTLLVFEQTFNGQHVEQREDFLDVAFEVISALGTVGLSTGVTPELTAISRLILMGLMFVGRLGPISVVAALTRSEREVRISYPKEEILVG